MKDQKIVLQPIGRIRSPRIAIEDDFWGGVISEIHLDSNILEESATWGLETFSHVEVVFYMDQIPVEKIEKGARHPRGNTAWPKIGILSQRGKNRFNQIGVSRAEILEVKGHFLKVKGLDAIDGTPVLDIKPYMSTFAPRGPIKEPSWANELMKDYYSL